jgi:hypothetical protein
MKYDTIIIIDATKRKIVSNIAPAKKRYFSLQLKLLPLEGRNY